MPKLPCFRPKQLVKILENNNFVLDRASGSHLIFFRQADKRRVTLPMHSKSLPPGTVMSILKEAGLSKDDLRRG